MRRQVRLHRSVGVQVADEGVVSNRDSTDLRTSVRNAVQIVKSVGVFIDRLLIAIQVEHLNPAVRDDS